MEKKKNIILAQVIVGLFITTSNADPIKEYITQYPLYGLQEVIIDSGWYKSSSVDSFIGNIINKLSPAATKAKTAAKNELSQKLKIEGKQKIESEIMFELADSCDHNENFVKELKIISETNEGGYAIAVASGGSAAASAYSWSSSYSTYYKTEGTFCKTPVQYTRAIIKATVDLVDSVKSSSVLNYYVSKHIYNSLLSYSKELDHFIMNLTTLSVNPYLTPEVLTGMNLQSGNQITVWFNNNIGRLKSAVEYSNYVKSLNFARQLQVHFDSIQAKIDGVYQVLSSFKKNGLNVGLLDSDKKVRTLTVATVQMIDKVLLNSDFRYPSEEIQVSKVSPEGLRKLEILYLCPKALEKIKNYYQDQYENIKIYQLIERNQKDLIDSANFLANNCSSAVRFEKVNVRSTMFYNNYDGSFRSGCYAYKFQMTYHQVDYYGDTVFKDGNLFFVCGSEK